MNTIPGANLKRTQRGPIEEGEEQRSRYSLASEAAKELRLALKNPANEQGYGLEVQIAYGRNPHNSELERQLQVSAWPLENKGALIHPSHIRALIEECIPGDTYENFSVRTLIAEPGVLEQIGCELGPEYNAAVIPLRKE